MRKGLESNMKIRYKDGSKEVIFRDLDDASHNTGFKPYMIRHFIKGDAKTHTENNGKFEWITDEVNEFGTELVIEKDIPGVTDIDKVVGIPVKYMDRGGGLHEFNSLLECHEFSGLSTNGLVSSLRNIGKLKGRVILNNGNDCCSYFPDGMDLEYSESFDPSKIDPEFFGNDFASVYREEFYNITKKLGKDLETISDIEVRYIDLHGVTHEYGSLKETSDYLKIHQLEILRSIVGTGLLLGRFTL